MINEYADQGMSCCVCGESIAEVDYSGDWANEPVCDGCHSRLTAEWKPAMADFAERHCEITRPLPEYDPEYEWRCTPKEYSEGFRDSYTENSHRAYCRHQCTNYDQLLRDNDLHKWDTCIEKKSLYLAIRNRIDELVEAWEEGQMEALLEGGATPPGE